MQISNCYEPLCVHIVKFYGVENNNSFGIEN